jgi:hypothetical protein
MLAFLQGKVSDRKLRLFFCACCRRIWSYMLDERSRKAVEVAERFCDGLATQAELFAAGNGAREAAQLTNSSEARVAWSAAWVAEHASSVRLPVSSVLSADALVNATLQMQIDYGREMRIASELSKRLDRKEKRTEAELLRHIVGNPFHQVSVDSRWCAWNDGTVPKLTQSIYADQGFDRLPILADALEDAGCDNADILAHCRGPGPHVRGCWVVDLILGKS